MRGNLKLAIVKLGVVFGTKTTLWVNIVFIKQAAHRSAAIAVRTMATARAALLATAMLMLASPTPSAAIDNGVGPSPLPRAPPWRPHL